MELTQWKISEIERKTGFTYDWNSDGEKFFWLEEPNEWNPAEMIGHIIYIENDGIRYESINEEGFVISTNIPLWILVRMGNLEGLL